VPIGSLQINYYKQFTAISVSILLLNWSYPSISLSLTLCLSLSVSHSLSLSLSVYPSLSLSLSHSPSLPPLFSPHSMSAAGRIGTSDLVDRTYRFVKKVREDEEAAAPKVYVPKSIDSDLIDEEDSVYN
jgi:hypothetical protein